MIRLVVAAVLTLATVATALPAIDDARAGRTDAGLEGAIDRIERAGQHLAASEDAVPRRARAASRRVAFRVPEASLTAARPAFVAVGGRPHGPGNRSVVAYASGGSPTRVRGLSLPIPLATPDGPVVFTASGRHAVDVALVGDAGRPTLVVTRG